MRFAYADSPIGRLLLVGQPGVLCGLSVADHERCRPPQAGWVEDPSAFVEVVRQLEEYFAGARTTFDLGIELSGTPFQLQVWDALREIPHGETWSYAELARHIGRATGFRAVGAANGRNPVSIVVPCHRVIGADRSLGGYGWGADRKAWLLAHEGALDPAMTRGEAS